MLTPPYFIFTQWMKYSQVVHIYDFSLAEKAYTNIMETALPLFRTVHRKIREGCQMKD